MKLQRRHLDYFIAIAEAKSFSKAASTLFVSQPSLSQQIAQLEDILGTPLFFRGRGHISLTKAGEFFYHQAKPIQQDLESIVSQTRAYAESTPLLVGLPDYHMFDSVASGLGTFSATHPDAILSKEMMAADMQRGLEEGDIHFGFIAQPFPFETNVLRSVSIEQTPLFLCLSAHSPLAKLDVIQPQSLSGVDLILLSKEDNPGFHHFVIDSLKQVGIYPTLSKANATGLQAQYSLVSAQLGVCLTLSHSPLPSASIVKRPIASDPLIHDLHLVWHKDLAHDCAETFKSLFSQQI